MTGAKSVFGNTQPTVYVDGVRIASGSSGNFNVFGQSTSALDAINPADIESVEVIKGPAAAAQRLKAARSESRGSTGLHRAGQ